MFFPALLTLRSHQDYWIGLFDPDRQDRPLSLDGRIVTYLSFPRDQPSNDDLQCIMGRFENVGSAVSPVYELHMHEADCTGSKPFICAKPSGNK